MLLGGAPEVLDLENKAGFKGFAIVKPWMQMNASVTGALQATTRHPVVHACQVASA